MSDTQTTSTTTSTAGTTTTERQAPEIQVFRVYIAAPAQRVWDAITTPELSTKYGYGVRVPWSGGVWGVGVAP